MTYFDYINILDLKDTKDAFIEYLVNVLDWKKTDAIDYAVIMYKQERGYENDSRH